MILGRLGSSILSNICKHGKARWSTQLEPASYPISLHLRDIHHLIPQEVDGGDIHQPMAAPQSPYTFSSPMWDATAGTSQMSITNILASGVESTQSVCLEAHSSLETLLMIFSPTQLAVQFLNHVHSSSGLPWWASIPIATLAIRTALLPLSLRAKASSANLILINEALAKARLLRGGLMRMEGGAAKAPSSVNPKEAPLMNHQHKAPAPAPASSVTSSELKPQGRSRLPPGMGMWSLSRGIYLYNQAEHRLPSLKWFFLNGIVQASIFSTFSLALSRMSSNMWPGLANEGCLYFTDLTSPAVLLQTLSAPFGTLGAILPLALVLLYSSSVDMSIGARVPGVLTALRIVTLPIYCLSLLQPHATLLCWGTIAVSHHLLQASLSRPAWSSFCGMPKILLTTSAGSNDLHSAISFGGSLSSPASTLDVHITASNGITAVTSESASTASITKGDAKLLAFLEQSFARRGRTEAAVTCYRMASELEHKAK